MEPTTSVRRREKVGVRRRCPSGGWLLRALRKISTLRPLMWLVNEQDVTFMLSQD